DDLQENAFLLKLGYDLSTGIDQAGKSNIAKVYPNPSNGKFTVSINDADLNQKATLYDLQGRAVQEIVLNSSNTQFYVQNAGIYLLVLENGYREKVVVR
ncbi:MAG: T9SS type A sorting domain-containing protein, partial [Flavobacteriales bacterium]